MRSSRTRIPKKLIAFLIILGVAGLTCLGVLLGMKLQKDRRDRIRRENELAAVRSENSAEEMPEEIQQDSSAESAESTPPEEDPEILKEEERTVAELDEQTRRANRENAQILIGLRDVASPYIGTAP